MATFDSTILSAELDFVSGAIEKNTTIPILTGVLIDQSKGGCTLTATDLELACISTFNSNTGSLSMVAPHKMLSKSVAAIGLGEIITITEDGKTKRMGVSGRKFTSSMGQFSRESFPELPKIPDSPGLDIPFTVLRDAFATVLHAISQEESRFILNGALLAFEGDMLRVVATDGHRLIVTEKNFPSLPVPLKFFIPTPALQVFRSLAGVAADCNFNWDENYVFFGVSAEHRSRTLMARKIKGTFPDYERVIPKSQETIYTVNREELIDVVKCMLPFCDKRAKYGTLELKGGVVYVGARDNWESHAVETMNPRVIIGPDCSHAFNLNYIREALRDLDSEIVALGMNPDTNSPGPLTIAGWRGEIKTLEVIMPVRP